MWVGLWEFHKAAIIVTEKMVLRRCSAIIGWRIFSLPNAGIYSTERVIGLASTDFFIVHISHLCGGGTARSMRIFKISAGKLRLF